MSVRTPQDGRTPRRPDDARAERDSTERTPEGRLTGSFVTRVSEPEDAGAVQASRSSATALNTAAVLAASRRSGCRPRR